jgi:DegV family protein with EDD domain
MRIGIVTDSACDLPPEVLSRLDVISVPLDVRLGATGSEQLAGLSAEEFWKRAAESEDLPETSAPSPGAFAEAFLAQRSKGYDAVVCVTISSDLSATFQAARAGAESVAGEVKVAVIDSRFATLGEGLIVLEAHEQAQKAENLDELAEQVRRVTERVQVMGTLDTLDNLRRGGRIGSAQAFIGSLLSIKPVVEVRNGVVEGESKQRTRGRSLQYLSDKVHAIGPLHRLAVVHAMARDVVKMEELLGDIAVDQPMITSIMGPVIGAHTGLGTIGIALLQKD